MEGAVKGGTGGTNGEGRRGLGRNARLARCGSVLDSLREVVFETDAAGRFTFLNRAWADASGRSVADNIGTAFWDAFHPEDCARHESAFSAALQGAADHFTGEARVLSPEGSVRWVDIEARLRYEGDRLLGLSGTMADISQLKKTEEDLQLCETRKDVLLNTLFELEDRIARRAAEVAFLNQTVERDSAERQRIAASLKESETRFRQAFDSSGIGKALISLKGRWLGVNQALADMLGYTMEEMPATRFRSVVHPDDLMLALVHARRLMAGKARSVRYEQRLVNKQGQVVWVAVSGSLVRNSYGKAAYFLGEIQDITERKQAAEALKASESRFRLLWQVSADGMRLIDSDGIIRMVNPAFCRMVRMREEELLGKSLAVIYSEDTKDHVIKSNIERLRARQTPDHIERQMTLWNDRTVWFSVSNSILERPSQAPLVLSVFRDITESKAMEERLAYQAFHDPLTGLPNRALFLDRLEHSLARTRRSLSPLAVFFVDMDNFKIINDSLGHKAGDQLLEAVGARLRRCMRSGDTAARFGGDEFTCILEGVGSEATARAVARKITAVLKEPFNLSGQEVIITPSIGIALSPIGDCRGEDLLRNADVALYEAKRKGKARHEVYRPDMNGRALQRLELENDLRRALNRGEIEVFYQPMVISETGHVCGVEALMRWNHPKRGTMSPCDFMAVAEETGLIVEIGKWILHESCRQAAEWHHAYPDEPPVHMSVNLSARQFQESTLVEDVAEALRKTGLRPDCLILEMTESVAMEQTDSTLDTLHNLKALGVQIAIDDFGTGYSSLAYLKSFPVDWIKIDRAFVSGLQEYKGDQKIVSAMVSLAHALGLKVVAEGVETPEQATELKTLGCDFVQGFFYARPQRRSAMSVYLTGPITPDPSMLATAGDAHIPLEVPVTTSG